LLDNVEAKLHEQDHKAGLYIVATPIGNLFDITIRAIHILKKSKIIFAEDTRQSKKLLNFYGIKSKLVPCHEHNEVDKSVTSLISNNEIYSLISDAGTPLISDPGYKLVNWCIENNIEVIPSPGACSFVAGLSASGIPTDQFLFFGFLPQKSKARKDVLFALRKQSSPLIFFESPNRILAALTDINEILGNRKCCVCRELTKLFEEFKRDKISELIEYFSKINRPLGEFIIIVSGNKEDNIDEECIFNELDIILKSRTLKDSVKYISQKYNASKKDVYKKALEITGGKVEIIEK
jgi:16S rRNA (cytidine1402-2'-O)-methyltransferase